MLEFLHALLQLDVKTMLAMLFWGNLVSAFLILTFQLTSRSAGEWRLSGYYALSKICLTMAYFCLFFRGSLPVFLSVNYGNTLLLTGLCLEALSLLSASRGGSRNIYVGVGFTLLCSISVFNIVEALRPEASIRVFTASVCVFAVLIVPCFKMLQAGSKSLFRRIVGVCYAFFVGLLIPRSIYAFIHEVDVHSGFFFQTLTFLTMGLLMVFSLLAYLLMIKENAEQHIAMLSKTDALTGLSNRQHFFEAGTAFFREQRDDGLPLALLIADVIDFKRINDMYGHNFGDQVLVRLSALLKAGLGGQDLAARHGAGEFVILLPQTERGAAAEVMKIIRRKVDESFFPQHAEFRLRVDIGCACGVPGESAASLEELIIQAERDMRERGAAASEYDFGETYPLRNGNQ